MLQVFLNALKSAPHYVSHLRSKEDHAEVSARWRSDPLAHPSLAEMNQRELADLPFEPRRLYDC